MSRANAPIGDPTLRSVSDPNAVIAARSAAGSADATPSLTTICPACARLASLAAVLTVEPKTSPRRFTTGGPAAMPARNIGKPWTRLISAVSLRRKVTAVAGLSLTTSTASPIVLMTSSAGPRTRVAEAANVSASCAAL